MSTRRLHPFLKLLLWLAAAIFSLGAMGAGYVLYSVYSFDTDTLPAQHGQVDARLFATEGPPRPMIVGLGGAEGRNAWASDFWRPQRERFEQAGYAMLAIGYFGLPNTPAQLDRIALDGVQAAIAKAQEDPRVNTQCVILLGGSKGAELALALASHYPDIDAVIALAPADTVFPAHTDALTTSSWSKDGKPLPFAPMPWSATLDFLRGDILAVMERILAGEEAEAARIAVERINGPILLLASTEDEMWPAAMMSRRILQRLEANGFAHARELVEVEGGHIEVTRHFDRVEQFLSETVAQRPGCDPIGKASDARR